MVMPLGTTNSSYKRMKNQIKIKKKKRTEEQRTPDKSNNLQKISKTLLVTHTNKMLIN